MNIVKVFSSPDSGTSGISENNTISIDVPTEINGRTAYRKTFYLRFQLDGYANGIRIKPDASEMSVQFSPYTINLAEGNDVFQSSSWQSEEDDNLVKIRLNHPWRLTKVKTNDSRGIDVFRLDGDALGAEPTIKANANTTISAEFIAQDFALRKVGIYASSELTTAIDTEMQHQPAQKHAMKGTPKAISSSPGVHDEVSASDFGVEVEEFGITQVPPHGIKWIRLVSYPTGPRIMLGEVNQEIMGDSQPTTWLIESGEFVQAAVSLNDTDSESFWQQLQTKIDRYIASMQGDSEVTLASIFIPITVESDTPSRFKFTALDINYSLIKSQWDHWNKEQIAAGKEVVSFAGNTLEEHRLTLNLPVAAHVEKAIIRIDTNVKVASGFTAGQLSADLNQAHGIMIPQGTQAAQCLCIDQAQNVNRIALAVMGVDEKMKAQVKISADQNGCPSGAELNTGEFEITAGNGTHWVLVPLELDSLLDIGNYWLVVTSNEGSLLWLADQVPGKVSIINGGKTHVQPINPLSALGFAIKDARSEPPLNLSLKLHDSLLEYPSNELDIASAIGNDIPDEVRLVSGESAQASIYAPEIEYS